MDRLDAGTSRLEADLVASMRPDTRLYALVDLANVKSDAPPLHRSYAALNAICVLGDLSPAAQLASPWLVSLPLAGSAALTCRRTVELARRSSAVSWIVSNLPASELARRLRARTEARLPDHYDVLLRHFDPRVLPILHQVLRPPQRDAFFNLGVAWLYLDRAASLARIELTPAPGHDCFEPPLQLDDNQAATLLDAAEIDAVMPELVKEEPDRFLALGDGPARYRFTQYWLTRARHWSLDQFPQKVAFCTLALRLGPKLDEAPSWQQALSCVADSGMRLSEAIEQSLGAASSEPKDVPSSV